MPSKAHMAAERKGAEARKAGKPRSACPYHRLGLGGRFGNIPTGARGFANAWLRGYDNAR